MKANNQGSSLSGRLSGIRQAWRLLAVLAVVWFGVCGVGVSRLDAGCIALDDVPLDVQQQQAPGIVMFLLDNSGSMDWEFLCPEDSGVFRATSNPDYEYVFANPGDNTFSTGSSNGTVLEGSADRNRWISQWAGYNHLYYDPTATYAPWPTQVDANKDNPRSNPVKTSPTLDMSGIWHDFGAPLISTDSLVNAGAVFVDNLDVLTGPPPAVEVIMDNDNNQNDNLWQGKYYGWFSQSPSGLNSNGWDDATSNNDYLSNYYYTRKKNLNGYTATWAFTNIVAGKYDVYAWWVGGSSFSTAVQYAINGTNVPTVNQENDGGKWVRLATDVDLNASPTVTLTHDNPNNNNNRACADAIKLVPKFSNTLQCLTFEKTGPLATGDNGWQRNTTALAYKTDKDTTANGSYYYTNAVGAFTATWTANCLDPNQLYDVYAIWAEGGSNRSTSVPYVTYHSGGTETTTINQQVALGDWTKIAGGTNGIKFTGGIGKVVLSRTTTSATSGRACADAVAFVPHGTLNVVINRAHYYTETASGRYLVNIDGSIQYYKFTDENNDGIVQDNELSRLTASQAAAAGVVTGRTYTQERQNFANWYSFYRRRMHTAKNAVGNVMNTMQGVYIGMLTINNDIKQEALPVRVTIDNVTEDQSAPLIAQLYTLIASGGTPLRTGLNNIGQYYKGLYGKPSPLPSTNFNNTSYPFFIADKGGSCQQAFTIVMTDGYWNDSYSGVLNADGDNNTPFDGKPYSDTYSNTLADVAMYYYERDLNSSLNDNVPINTKDTAGFQHLVTYSLSFGLSGEVDQGNYADCPLGNCPTWPQPVADKKSTVDDLWHAAVNGRGRYINASNPMDMVDAMNALKQDIESRLGSAASLATSSIQRQVGTNIYQGIYNTAGWFGEVYAKPINVETGAVGEPVWTASNHVPAWNSRKIFSYDGSGGIVFAFNNISADQEDLLSVNSADPANPFDPAKMVDFIRGDTSNNLSRGGQFRVRTKILGDFIHSAPTYYKGTLYIGSNDGMLHAIDASNGNERFCYVPGLVYDHLSDLAIPGYSHRYYVDGSATVGKVGSQDILVCGLGKGGKGYFGLDVTAPDAMSANKVLWEFPAATDDDMGYSFSNAVLVKTEAAGPVVVFGNGYDSVNQKAILYIVDPLSGALVKKLDTLTAGCNGLSTPRVVDVDGDGYADYAFAGDLLGNMWKFDLRGKLVSDWKVYYAAGSTPKPLITVRNSSGTGYVQPITTAPEVMLDCVKSNFADTGAGLMVIFGTGRYLNASDLGNMSTQSFYGIWDWGNIWEEKYGGGATGYSVAKTRYLGTFEASRILSNVSGKTLLRQTISTGSTADNWLFLSNNQISWYDPVKNTGSHMGWYIDLPQAGERGIREPMLRKGTAVLISTIPSSSPCEAGGSSVIYQISACSGGQTDSPQFDVDGDGEIDDTLLVDVNGDGKFDANDKFDANGDGKIDKNDVNKDLIEDLPPGGLEYETIVFEPIEIGNMLYMPDSQGGEEELVVPDNLVGMQYWRIIQ
ncbi:MAG: hypothetical protein C4518_11450 [Desulfobacteraceae bacterium]|nr:MAG: hypothetical protein C4518_11450 [Desulfobacteraceae bacterium]